MQMSFLQFTIQNSLFLIHIVIPVNNTGQGEPSATVAVVL